MRRNPGGFLGAGLCVWESACCGRARAGRFYIRFVKGGGMGAAGESASACASVRSVSSWDGGRDILPGIQAFLRGVSSPSLPRATARPESLGPERADAQPSPRNR